ncbi:MAG TPA: hypothetical protein VFC38_04195 [Stellaceae bacterium]|nr:hypothetical protein [Stellaceae bacterium]
MDNNRNQPNQSGGQKPQAGQQYGTDHGKPARDNPTGGAEGAPERHPQPQDRQQKDGKAQTEQARHQDHGAGQPQKVAVKGRSIGK